MQPQPPTDPVHDRDRLRRRVRALTSATVATAAVGSIALTVAIAGNADAAGSSGGTGFGSSQPGNAGSGESQITVPQNLPGGSADSGTTDFGGQLVPSGQQPQSGGGNGSHAGSGGS